MSILPAIEGFFFAWHVRAPAFMASVWSFTLIVAIDYKGFTLATSDVNALAESAKIIASNATRVIETTR